MFSKLRKQRGLSLVELLVALVIGLFLTGGIFTMFSMSATNVTTTSQFGQLQENGRIALAILERNLTQVGFMGDITGTDFIVGGNTTLSSLPSLASDCAETEGNNATFPKNTVPPLHFRKLWGYESEGTSAEPLACLNSSSVLPQTDVIQVKRVIGPNVEAVDVDDARFYLATTSNQAVFFKGDAAAPTLENARFWEYQHHVYFVANNIDRVPELRRKTLTATGMSNDEQLVEGIENIRILYGFDSDGDDAADTYVPVKNVTSLMWDNELFQRLVSLQVYLLVRSVEEDKNYKNDIVYTLGDKTLPKFNDHYRRKVVSTTIVLENPVLIRN